MAGKEKDTADYMEKVRSEEGEFDAIFKDVTEDMDIVLLSTDEDGDPRYKIRDYPPFHIENRKIVHLLRSETDYNWTDYGFRRKASLSECEYDVVYRPGALVSDEAYTDQVEQFSSAVFDKSLYELAEIDVIE